MSCGPSHGLRQRVFWTCSLPASSWRSPRSKRTPVVSDLSATGRRPPAGLRAAPRVAGARTGITPRAARNADLRRDRASRRSEHATGAALRATAAQHDEPGVPPRNAAGGTEIAPECAARHWSVHWHDTARHSARLGGSDSHERAPTLTQRCTHTRCARSLHDSAALGRLCFAAGRTSPGPDTAHAGPNAQNVASRAAGSKPYRVCIFL